MVDPKKIIEDILREQAERQSVKIPAVLPSKTDTKPNVFLEMDKLNLPSWLEINAMKDPYYIPIDSQYKTIDWKEEKMIFPLFQWFMSFDESSIRFERIYDADPEYYFGKLKEHFPDHLPLTYPVVGLTYDNNDFAWMFQNIKALAVHYSDRPEDIYQLTKFYQKKFRKNNLTLPELDIGKAVDLSTFIGAHVLRLFASVKTGSEYLEELFKEITFLVSVAIHRGVVFKERIEITSVIYFCFFLSYGLFGFEADFLGDHVPTEKFLGKEFKTDNLFPVEKSFPTFFTYMSSPSKNFQKAMTELLDNKNSLFSPVYAKVFMRYSSFYKYLISDLVEECLKKEIASKHAAEKESQITTEKITSKNSSITTEVILRKQLSETTEALVQSKRKADEISALLTDTKQEVSQKENKIKMLEQQINELTSDLDDAELLLLTDDVEEDEDDASLSDDELDLLNSCRIVVVGGHDHLHRQLSERVPNIRFIEPNAGQIDYNLIRNADIVSFITNHCSHSVYRRTKQQAKIDKKKMSHHNSNHANFICRTILNELLGN